LPKSYNNWLKAKIKTKKSLIYRKWIVLLAQAVALDNQLIALAILVLEDGISAAFDAM
jgi:hypothetical protein